MVSAEGLRAGVWAWWGAGAEGDGKVGLDRPLWKEGGGGRREESFEADLEPSGARLSASEQELRSRGVDGWRVLEGDLGRAGRSERRVVRTSA